MIRKHDYKELIVWKKSVELSLMVYKVTDKFPKSEMYTLQSQIRGAAISVPSNIAEGQGRGSKKEFLQFLKISFGSLLELETQLYIAKELKYLSDNEYSEFEGQSREVKKMLLGLQKSLNSG